MLHFVQHDNRDLSDNVKVVAALRKKNSNQE